MGSAAGGGREKGNGMNGLGARRHAIGVALFGVLGAASAIEAQDRAFHGAYLGVEAAREDLIGGSLVDGVDVLAQDDRGVLSVVGGARYQASWGLVIGAEGTVGATDGELAYTSPDGGLSVQYSNSRQTSLGAQVGYAFRSSMPVLLFAYASEVTRRFDVRVTQGASAFDQTDEQGMLRYGIGTEIEVVRGLLMRARIGSGRADFGSAITNFAPEPAPQFGFAVVYQF